MPPSGSSTGRESTRWCRCPLTWFLLRVAGLPCGHCRAGLGTSKGRPGSTGPRPGIDRPIARTSAASRTALPVIATGVPGYPSCRSARARTLASCPGRWPAGLGPAEPPTPARRALRSRAGASSAGHETDPLHDGPRSDAGKPHPAHRPVKRIPPSPDHPPPPTGPSMAASARPEGTPASMSPGSAGPSGESADCYTHATRNDAQTNQICTRRRLYSDPGRHAERQGSRASDALKAYHRASRRISRPPPDDPMARWPRRALPGADSCHRLPERRPLFVLGRR